MTDILAFAAHPDDVEMGAGGTLLKMKSDGFKTAIVDLTKGDLSSRGTVESRAKEIEVASKILNLNYRENLALADGRFEFSEENRIKIMDMIRKFKPRLVLAPYFEDRHPDHERCSKLVKEACFYAGLIKYKSDYPAHKVQRLYYYMANNEFIPRLTINISNFFEKKVELYRAFSSQFFNPNKTDQVPTHISRPEFLDFVKARARFYGEKSGFLYGEPFYCDHFIGLEQFPEL